ncbi:hypothetical protein [Candidatus Electrothrix sp.]|uniref:hypothetical protein n=1 Tax=Candidatus Electrothrix sp. TaxID=2170559 RepID=UPI0040579394
MVLSEKIIIFIIIIGSFFCTSAWAGTKRINSYDELPPEVAVVRICPDGVRRLLVAVEEPIIKGAPYVKARAIAQKIATIKAKATLADFIKGSEFEQTAIITDAVHQQGDSGLFTTDYESQYIARMRTAALRGIEVRAVKEPPGQKSIKVVVGFSDKSRQTADVYDGILNNHSIPTPDRNSSRVAPAPTSRLDWTAD